jgi:hypothetical protein
VGLLVIAFLLIFYIFIILCIVSLDNTNVHMSKIARVILIVMVICCLMACFIFFNWCNISLLRDGFC